MTAAERRELIMATLRKERKVTMKHLSAALGCSMSTVYRDIEALSVYLPLILTRGRYDGGVELADWYQPHHNVLRSEQIRALYTAMETADPQTRKVLGSILDQFSPTR